MNLREIEALGYNGKRTVLRAYIQPKRKLRSGRATVRLETEPGVQLQSDWGTIQVYRKASSMTMPSEYAI